MADDMLTAPRQVARRDPEVAALQALETRAMWLAAWMIHVANHERESRDGLKVGGHQASCASIATVMAALYGAVLTPRDRVAVKPHASPVLHALEYLFGRQTRANLERFRALGGAQAYPSRTKDAIPVDFSTGSVGLGVAVTAFAALAQEMLIRQARMPEADRGRMIALLGDAELDEGNIYEALIEAHKHRIQDVWWIVDYNRQSLDAVAPGRMAAPFEDIFRACGWKVDVVKYGVAQRAAFAQPGGGALRAWIDACPNDLHAALTYGGGAAWRAQLETDLGADAQAAELIAAYDDHGLATLMTDLGGHCMASVLAALRGAAADRAPRLIIAYTSKGRGLPFEGHKDNHAGLMTPAQTGAYRDALGIPAGEEWAPYAGLDEADAAALKRFIEGCAYAAPRPAPAARDGGLAPPQGAAFPRPKGARQSTQAAFGKILAELARRDGAFADSLVTMSPDVTVSTNLGGFVNRRGVFAADARPDPFQDRKLDSAQKWSQGPEGRHVELGIAENNLFLALAAFGLTGPLFGAPATPIGTLYDPFIARGLDALNYALYQDARFILAATPSGLALAPEGGAHQSVSAPLIGMGQPGLDSYEPAFADELAVLMRRAMARMHQADGASAYFRLSTRPVAQPERIDEAWEADAEAGAYWRVAPAAGADLAIVYAGAVAPEAEDAHAGLLDDLPGAGLLAVTSADLLHRDWTRAGRARWSGEGAPASHVERLLAPLAPGAGLITLTDGAPATLSWLGSVRGQPARALGVERFGQSGDIQDLFQVYRLDPEAVYDAAADLVLAR